MRTTPTHIQGTLDTSHTMCVHNMYNDHVYACILVIIPYYKRRMWPLEQEQSTTVHVCMCLFTRQAY